MLMTHDEFDRLLVKCLSDSTRKNIKEILDTIRVKVIRNKNLNAYIFKKSKT